MHYILDVKLLQSSPILIGLVGAKEQVKTVGHWGIHFDGRLGAPDALRKMIKLIKKVLK